jgi:hypothetical protein
VQPDARDSSSRDVADVSDADTGDVSPDADTWDSDDPDGWEAPTCYRPDRIESALDDCERVDESGLDDDGLTAQEEANLCGGEGSDPRKTDTDGDGANDCEERALGTDACDPDTDGDGGGDWEEYLLCLDPTNDQDPNAYEEWILDECQANSGEDPTIEESSQGGWKFVRHPSIQSFSKLEYEGKDDRASLAHFRAKDPQAFGAVSSWTPQVGADSSHPIDVAGQRLRPTLEGRGDLTVVTRWDAIGNYPLEGRWRLYKLDLPDENLASPAKLRNEASRSIHPHVPSGFGGLPDAAGREAGEFLVAIGTNHPRNRSNEHCSDYSSDLDYLQTVLVVLPVSEAVSPHERKRIAKLSHPIQLQVKISRVSFRCDRWAETYGRAERREGGDIRYGFGNAPIFSTVHVKTSERGGTDDYHFPEKPHHIRVESSAWPMPRPSGSLRFGAVRYHEWSYLCRPLCGITDHCLGR